jgi:hypothetical protein
MKLKLIFFWILICSLGLYGQSENEVDTNYLEDQFYVSLSYDLLINKPETITQNGFSGGFSMGFIKDIPLNNNRNVGVAVGLGYGYDAYIQNLKISGDGTSSSSFEMATEYSGNSLKLHFLELPFEVRWRNSSPTRYKFWRAYAGVKLGYLITGKSKFSDVNGIIEMDKIPELEDLHMNLYIAIGYGTWNIYASLGLNDLFNNTQFNGAPLDIRPFKIGLKFYIL